MSVHFVSDIQGNSVVMASARVANAAGSAAGVPVSTAVKFMNPPPYHNGGALPDGVLINDQIVFRWNVHVTPSQPCFATVSDKSTKGFSVTLTPRDNETTITAGSFEVTVVGDR
jgi:hypothetical protein